MPEEEREDDDIETGEGSAEPNTLDADAARERWETREPQSKDRLDERQRRIGARRRPGGPDLHGETEARDDLDQDTGGVDPTEPEDEDEG